VPLSNFVPRGFGFVHHSIAILWTKCQTLVSRFATFSSQYDGWGGGGAAGAGNTSADPKRPEQGTSFQDRLAVVARLFDLFLVRCVFVLHFTCEHGGRELRGSQPTRLWRPTLRMEQKPALSSVREPGSRAVALSEAACGDAEGGRGTRSSDALMPVYLGVTLLTHFKETILQRKNSPKGLANPSAVGRWVVHALPAMLNAHVLPQVPLHPHPSHNSPLGLSVWFPSNRGWGAAARRDHAREPGCRPPTLSRTRRSAWALLFEAAAAFPSRLAMLSSSAGDRQNHRAAPLAAAARADGAGPQAARGVLLLHLPVHLDAPAAARRPHPAARQRLHGALRGQDQQQGAAAWLGAVRTSQ
jgi:hypothetical protein